MTIRILAPDVAAKIAAGEVVERPASIVKELVENAIDAGATRITIDLEAGGLTALRVTDNGGGIPRAELPLAFARHATSKIAAVDDLDQLHTLGFRGEALASIGAVAAVTLASRTPEATSGTQIMVTHGSAEPPTPIAMPPGTIITVRELFARIPARLKFMKSAQGEAAHCKDIIEHCALAYPEIAFTLQHDGRLGLRTSGDGDLLHAVAAVYDLKTAEQMIAISHGDPAGSLPDASGSPALLDRSPVVRGLTSRPAAFKSTRSHMQIFVNRRWVRSTTLTHAIEEAYHGLLLTGRHPISVVLITLDPALVDVNVHPAKTEVKFARDRQVYAAVQRAVRAAILATTEAPALSPQAFSPAVSQRAETLEDARDAATHTDADAPYAPPPVIERPELAYVPPGGLRHAATASPAAAAMSQSTNAPPLWTPQDMRQVVRPTPREQPVATPPPPPRLPALRVLGQVSQSYIITEGPDGVYLIDQHAAHERILLEKMVAQWRQQGVPSQGLLEPVVVELSPETFTAVEERLTDLAAMAFAIEIFGPAAILVRAVPAPLAAHALAEDLRDLLQELVGVESAGHGETWEEHVLANVACKAAIRAGQALSPDEQRALVRQLEQVDAPHSCCHGRPTTVHLSLDALEREFGRR